MHRKFAPFFSLVLFVTVVLGFFFVSAEKSAAQGCFIEVTKIAPGAEGQVFEFNGVVEGQNIFTFFVAAGESTSGFASPDPATITEVPVAGWEFGGIECEPGGGVVILEVLEDGWVEQCVNPQAPTFCTIFNDPVAAAIPTLSEWGMIAAAAGLMMVGAWFVLKRKKAQIV
ncbi:MAG: hypothetical protein AB1598_06055 [Thermodesulfobacteriota bacterium]